MKFLAGLLLVAGTLTLVASPVEDKVQPFIEAVRAAAEVEGANPRPWQRGVSAEDLRDAIQHGDRDNLAEAIVSQLIASHPSAQVQTTGQSLLATLEQRRQARILDFAARSQVVLDQAKDLIVQAQRPADLDGLITKLQALHNAVMEDSSAATPRVVGKIEATLEFATTWQNYLSASAAGNAEEVRQALQQILSNPSPGFVQFFPRSEILARLDGPPRSTVAGTQEDPAAEADDLMTKVKSVDEIQDLINHVRAIPNEPFNLDFLLKLEKNRLDVEDGLPATLDLQDAVQGSNFVGQNDSRLVALELLHILPFYLGTQVSDPPRHDELLGAYLDRIAAQADASGNLALLQRALALKVALVRVQGQEQLSSQLGTPMEMFLAGLSQDADSQYAEAVVSYEKSLATYDPLVPIKIVGTRLAAIKSAHPNEFTQGEMQFLTPPPASDPRFPMGFPSNPMQRQMMMVSVLPIPLYLNIPASTGPTSTPVTK